MNLNPPGRETELDQAERSIRDRGCRLFELTGKSGVGKSTFARALCERLEKEYLVVQASAARVDLALDCDSLLHRVLLSLQMRLNPEEMAKLIEKPRMRPFFQAARQDDSAESHDELSHQLLLEAFLELLRELGHRKPVLLCLDDFQQADSPGQQLVHGLLEHPAYDTLRLVLLVVHTELDHHGLGEPWSLLAGSHPDMEQLRLDPLDREGLAGLVSQELDSSVNQQLPELPDLLWTASRGNPLMAATLVRAARRKGALRATINGWVLDAGYFTEAREVHQLLRESIEPLIDAHPQIRFLVSWLQLAASPVSLKPLETLAPLKDSTWTDLAALLQRAGVLERFRLRDTDTGWSFAHGSWQDDALLLLEANELQEFIGELLGVMQDSDLYPELKARLLLTTNKTNDRESACKLLGERLDLLGNRPDTLVSRIRIRELLLKTTDNDEQKSEVFYSLLRDTKRLGNLEKQKSLCDSVQPGRLNPKARALRMEVLANLERLKLQSSGALHWLESRLEEQDLATEERQVLLQNFMEELFAQAPGDPRHQTLYKEFDGLELEPELWARHQLYRVTLKARAGRNYYQAFLDLEALLKEARNRKCQNVQHRILVWMVNYSRLCGKPNLAREHVDYMLELTEKLDQGSVHSKRSTRIRAYSLAGRMKDAERILREDMQYFSARNNLRAARERMVGLVAQLRYERRLSEAAELFGRSKLQPNYVPDDHFSLSYVLTAASVYWRMSDIEETERMLLIAEKGGVTTHDELQVAYQFSRAMLKSMQAETGGSWQEARDSAAELFELFQLTGNKGVNAMLFDAMRVRADLELANPVRERAADFLSTMALAKQRNDYDRTRVVVQIGEVALLTGEEDILDLVIQELEDCKEDRHLALLFLARLASAHGRTGERDALLLECCCTARNKGFERFVQYAISAVHGQACPESLEPGPETPPRQVAFYAFSLREWFRQGLPCGLPAKLLVDGRDHWYTGELFRLRNLAEAFEPLERNRLEQELDALEQILFESGSRYTRRPGLQLFLFNGPKLFHGGVEVDQDSLHSKTAFQLLALLAVRQWQGKGRICKDELVERLRVDGLPQVSESSLKVVVSRVRKALKELTGQDLLLGGRGGYALSDKAIAWLDVAHFEMQANNAVSALREGRVEAAGRFLDEAIHAYTGSFMVHANSDWNESLAAYFERRAMDLIRERLRLWRDDPVRAQEMLERLRCRLPELADVLPKVASGLAEAK